MSRSVPGIFQYAAMSMVHYMKSAVINEATYCGLLCIAILPWQPSQCLAGVFLTSASGQDRARQLFDSEKNRNLNLTNQLNEISIEC